MSLQAEARWQTDDDFQGDEMKKQEAASHSPHAVPTMRPAEPSVTKPQRKSSVADVAVVSAASGNGHEELIRQRAYSLYEARNYESGHELEDWLQAEAQISQSRTRESGHP